MIRKLPRLVDVYSWPAWKRGEEERIEVPVGVDAVTIGGRSEAAVVELRARELPVPLLLERDRPLPTAGISALMVRPGPDHAGAEWNGWGHRLEIELYEGDADYLPRRRNTLRYETAHTTDGVNATLPPDDADYRVPPVEGTTQGDDGSIIYTNGIEGGSARDTWWRPFYGRSEAYLTLEHDFGSSGEDVFWQLLGMNVRGDRTHVWSLIPDSNKDLSSYETLAQGDDDGWALYNIRADWLIWRAYYDDSGGAASDLRVRTTLEVIDR